MRLRKCKEKEDGTPEEPCIQLFYKRPELIPEEYFTRVGKIKKIKGDKDK